MSRFFTAPSSGSEDESSDEAPVITQKAATTVGSRFVKNLCLIIKNLCLYIT